jgi:hypothetical protein
MSKVYKGTTTNNVTELTLQEEGVGNIGTQTVVWDSAQGTIDQVIGAIPDNWKQNVNTLKQLQIGSSCTTIGSIAFYYCGFTGSLTIPDNVTSIGSQAFQGCTGFTGTLRISKNITSIGSYTFNNCSGLNGSLTIGNSVASIGSGAFYYCTGLTSLTIPNSVTTIGPNAFFGCTGLTAVYTNTPASSFTGFGAFSVTTFTTIYTGPNATGYTSSFQGRNGLTISPWTNYPNIP